MTDQDEAALRAELVAARDGADGAERGSVATSGAGDGVPGRVTLGPAPIYGDGFVSLGLSPFGKWAGSVVLARAEAVAVRDALTRLIGDDPRAELARWHAKCDEVGVPYNPDGFVRHHRGNAGVAAAAEVLIEVTKRDQAIERVRALHAPAQGPTGPAYCDGDNGSGCNFAWPCPTIRALDGEDG